MRAVCQIAGLPSARCAHVLALRAGAFVIEYWTAFARTVAPRQPAIFGAVVRFWSWPARSARLRAISMLLMPSRRSESVHHVHGWMLVRREDKGVFHPLNTF